MLEEHFMALDDANASIKLNPTYSKAYRRAGNAHLVLGEPEEAVTAFEKVLELEPQDTTIKAALAQARKAAGHEEVQSPSTASNSPLSSGLNGLNLGSLMSDPNFMSMANQMMSSGALDNLMKDPNAKKMMEGMLGDPNLMKQFEK